MAPGHMLNCEEILAVDIGNTSVHLGIVRGTKVVRKARILSSVTNRKRILKVLHKLSIGRRLRSVLSSVVPRCTSLWTRCLRECGVEVIPVTSNLNLGVSLVYPRANRLGADRLVNVCGAARLYSRPLIIIDVGTATTIDVVTKQNEFVGGFILPGPETMLKSLAAETALLPLVKWSDSEKVAIGKDTVTAIQVGLKLAYRGILKETVSYLSGLYAGGGTMTVCLTGGYAERLSGAIKCVVNPDLTLIGLGIIGQLNEGRRR